MNIHNRVGYILFHIIVALFFCLPSNCQQKSEIRIANPTIQQKNNQIHVRYDLLTGNSSESYNVRMEVTDANGNILNAKSFKGDIGPNILGGDKKEIVWNLAADQIYLDADIFIQVFVQSALHAEFGNSASGNVPSKNFSRNGIILQSLAFPGLGLSRLTGKPHWLRGVAGYGCIGGAIYFKKIANRSYNDYLNALSADDAQIYLDNTTRQDNISDAFTYSAIGIWVIDLIWNIVGTSDMRKPQMSGDSGGISIGTDYDMLSHAPLLSVKYMF